MNNETQNKTITDKVQLIPQNVWDEIETLMGEKLSDNSEMYDAQLHEMVIEIMGCMTDKKLFVSIAKAALESIEIIVEEGL